jgi:dCTP deaminase
VSVLPDHEIVERCPFRALQDDRVQPASVDVTLSAFFLVPRYADSRPIDLGDRDSYRDRTERIVTERYVLRPGHFVLGSTEDYVKVPEDLVARIEGKSSLARFGLLVHATGGFIDPGFEGNVTLEMANLWHSPIVLRAGAMIAQIAFMTMTSPPQRTYGDPDLRSKYQGSRGTVESRYSAS